MTLNPVAQLPDSLIEKEFPKYSKSIKVSLIITSNRQKEYLNLDE